MHRLLFASTATLALVAGTAASAQTVIDTKRTTPVRTATVNNGAAADISIAAAGSVVTSGSGTAVTIDSNNKLANAGTIQTTDANDAIGIGAAAGVTGDIANSGKIILDETYTPTDIDKDGDLDGPSPKARGGPASARQAALPATSPIAARSPSRAMIRQASI